MSNYEKITLGEIKADVRSLLDDDQYDEDKIARAANDFQNELFTRYKLRMAEASDTLNISQADTSVEFPVDFLTLLEMTLIYSATQYQNIKKHYVGYEDFMRNYANFSVASQMRPQTWTEFGGGARFSNPSDADYVLNIDYIRLPEMMVDDSDESELRKVWREVMNLGTLARVMEINEDYEEASQERDKLDPFLTTFVAREGRGTIKVGPNIIGQGRGRSTYRADRDFR